MNRPDTEHGFEFEKSFADRHGLEPVPGSGNQFAWKLDLNGFGVRWSLKSTRSRSFPIGVGDIDEAIEACLGPGGTGEAPMWGIRIHDDDHILVVMREPEFVRLGTGRLELRRESKDEARRRKAAVPELLREEEE